MPVRTPKTLRIGGRRVRVKVEHSGSLNTSIMGRHNGWENVISLDDSLAPDELRACALHEVFHDIDQLCGTGLDEQAVTSLASVLFATLRDNPGFVLWLMEKR